MSYCNLSPKEKKATNSEADIFIQHFMIKFTTTGQQILKLNYTFS